MTAPALSALLAREGTGISWAHMTFNAWLGCQKVSPACDNCYADDLCRARLGVIFGPREPRRRTSPSNWKKPLRWQKIAQAAGVQLRVFGGSLMDWADNAAPDGARRDLADTIRRTPNLTWMMLTKRIGNAEAMLREMFPEGVPGNVWIGITIANQKEADRDVPKLFDVVRRLDLQMPFASIEPMLGPVSLTSIDPTGGQRKIGASGWSAIWKDNALGRPWFSLVICGGESGGKKARPMHPAWPLELGNQCWHAGVAFHFKQWGDWRWTEAGPFAMNGDPPGTHRLITSVDVDGRKFEGDRLHQFKDGVTMIRVGAAKSGRLLAGREWLEEMAA